MPSQKAALDLIEVRKSFGKTEIIRGVDLVVRAGERHAIIGPNGAGKSTLFNLISGRLSVSSGKILLNGTAIHNKAPHRISRLGLSRSFQITSLFSRLSVFEHFRLGMLSSNQLRNCATRQADSMIDIGRRADEALEAVGLGRNRNTAAGDLAYAEQRSLEIGTTLSTDPDVVLLDEPTAGMTRDDAKRAVDLVRKATTGKTLLIVEHDMDVVFSLCDVISVLVYGQIIATGSPEEIRKNKQVQEAYLGVEFGEPA